MYKSNHDLFLLEFIIVFENGNNLLKSLIKNKKTEENRRFININSAI